MIKAMTFACVHFSVAFTITYLLTGSLVLGGLIALVEPMVNTVAYFFHEKVWEKIYKRRAKRQKAIQEQHHYMTV